MLVFEENSATAMLLAHVQKPAVPPSKRTGHAVPESLERAVMMCLEKDPESRPESADTLARALTDCQVSSAWTQHEAKHWWQKNLPEGAPRIHSEDDRPTITKSMTVMNELPTL
jgi:hypothetical protein